MEALLSCWHPTMESYAVVTPDNRLKIWDVATGGLRQQCTDEDHLNTVYTAVAWGVAASSKKRKKKRDRQAPPGSGLVAVGSQSGVIVVWDITVGEVVQRLEGHTQAVNGLAFSADASVLYSCSDDKFIVEWAVSQGKETGRWQAGKHAVRAIAVSPDGAMVAAGSSTVTVWDVATKTDVCSFTGHSTHILPDCLQFTADSKALFTGAEDDRFVNMWLVEETSSAVQVLTLDEPPVSLAVAQGSKDGHYSLVATLVSGVAVVWFDIRTWKKKKKLKVPKPLIASAVVRVDNGGLLGATWAASSSDTTLELAYGSVAKPTFSSEQLITADGDVIPEISLHYSAGSLLLGEVTSGIKTTSNGQGVVMMDTASSRVRQPTLALNGEPPAKRSRLRRGRDKERRGPKPQPRVSKPGTGMTMGERLAEGSQANLPKADSLSRVLMQALQSNDISLLEYVLGFADQAVIDRTVARLPAALVVPFLTTLIDRFRTRPSRGPVLAAWIRATLVQHVSYLMTVPDLADVLSPLFHTVEDRLSVFKRLMKLSGRLDLLMSQVKTQKERVEVSAPMTIYNEGSESEDEPDAENDSANDDAEDIEDEEDEDDDDDDDDDEEDEYEDDDE